MGIRLHPDDTLFDTLARIAAARIARNTVVVSVPENLDNAATLFLDSGDARDLLSATALRRQSDEELAASFTVLHRVRYAAPDRVPDTVLKRAADLGYYIAREPVLMEGRLELMHYVQNQSICDSYHRYGNLGERTELPV